MTLIDDGGTNDRLQYEAAQGAYAEQVADDVIDLIHKATVCVGATVGLEVLNEVRARVELLIENHELVQAMQPIEPFSSSSAHPLLAAEDASILRDRNYDEFAGVGR